MLTQRLGALNVDDYLHKDKEQRIYYDKFVDCEDGRMYKGQWSKKNNKKDGIGILFFKDGSKYEGQFKNGFMSGKGRKLFVNGEYYLGEFALDKANGYGTFRDLNGGKYEGGWKDDK